MTVTLDAAPRAPQDGSSWGPSQEARCPLTCSRRSGRGCTRGHHPPAHAHVLGPMGQPEGGSSSHYQSALGSPLTAATDDGEREASGGHSFIQQTHGELTQGQPVPASPHSRVTAVATGTMRKPFPPHLLARITPGGQCCCTASHQQGAASLPARHPQSTQGSYGRPARGGRGPLCPTLTEPRLETLSQPQHQWAALPGSPERPRPLQVLHCLGGSPLLGPVTQDSDSGSFFKDFILAVRPGWPAPGPAEEPARRYRGLGRPLTAGPVQSMASRV